MDHPFSFECTHSSTQNSISHIRNLIHDKMDNAKPQLQIPVNRITSKFINNWDINVVMGSLSTMVWVKILEAMTETQQSKMKEKAWVAKTQTLEPSSVYIWSIILDNIRALMLFMEVNGKAASLM